MPTPLLPARLAFAPDGTPCSEHYDDVYHSADGGPAQARHVFLGGNGLPLRWRGRSRFTILEAGFGLGLNFLATWAAWRDDPLRPSRLHFVSIEKHPFTAPDLAQLHARYPELGALSAQLRAAWPLLLPGAHRLEFEGGRLVLTLYFEDIERALPQLRLGADAFYLDGFSPDRNPQMWAPRALKALGRLAAADATLATYTAASAVRAGLGAAGFAVEKRPGFGRKREMSCARFSLSRPLPAEPVRNAMIIGAGLAGAAVCERLATRGWTVTLLEKLGEPAQGASGNHSGAFHPLVTADDSILARLSRAAFLHSLRHWAQLEGLVEGLEWARCGVLQMARHADEAAAQRAALDLHAYPAEYARCLDRAAAAVAAGTQVADGGLWFERGGWIRPRSLVQALLRKAGVQALCGREVAELQRGNDAWRALDSAGRILAEAPAVVLANAQDAMRLHPVQGLALRLVRGQLTHLPADRLPSFAPVLLRGGILLPAVAGTAVAGASYDIGDEDPLVRIDSHAGNLQRLGRILPGTEGAFDPAALTGRVGFRAVALDRMPVVGPLTDAQEAGATYGAYGAFAYASRGIIWSSLMAELLVSRMEGEPLPVESKLADAVAPERFALRARRKAG